MARERPTASDISALSGLDGGAPARDVPRATRAEAHVLRRSAPRTHARLAEIFEPLRTTTNGWIEGSGEAADAMHGDTVHTVFRSATGNWANQVTSGERVYGVYATQEEAVRRGQALARAAQVNHVIHDADGTVRSLNAYRDDPRSL